MEQNKVYIDFEAITNPFARLLNLPSGTPYAYTLGLLNIKNKFEVKTFIMDFTKHNSLSSIWNIIRKKIILDINKINSKLNINDVIFIGHNPVLENKCLKKLFPTNKVLPLIDKQNVSLSKLTGKTFNIPYFSETKKTLTKLGTDTLLKNIVERNGAIASFAGYWLYTNSLKNLRVNDKKKKYFINLNKKILLRELNKYSNDDVVKMLYISTNENALPIMLKELGYKRELLKQIRNLKLNEKLTIKEIKEKIWNL
ncbi:DUF2779 domain-containing protein [Metamycoplasma buccale]|uniref:DUF2779 domain-containing protein n=1 Tax=Metamycoplasma buccale TaxID=55602 RepID=UPI00398F2C23